MERCVFISANNFTEELIVQNFVLSQCLLDLIFSSMRCLQKLGDAKELDTITVLPNAILLDTSPLAAFDHCSVFLVDANEVKTSMK